VSPTLFEAICQIARSAKGGTTGGRPSGDFFEQGEVAMVGGTGNLMVVVGGRTVEAKPVTDEPFKVGSKVWVSSAAGGYIVHGGVR
jgi:hypothetical protein